MNKQINKISEAIQKSSGGGDSKEQKKLVLVDDHEMILIGMKTFLENKTDWTVTGEAKSITLNVL